MEIMQLLERNNISVIYDIGVDINVPEGSVLLLNGRYTNVDEYKNTPPSSVIESDNINNKGDYPINHFKCVAEQALNVYKNWGKNDPIVQRHIIERILPRKKTDEQLKIMEEFLQVYLYGDINCHNGLRMEYYEKIEQQRKDTARSLYLEMYTEGEEMSMECFNSILEHCGNPNYIIVTNDFVYEHLPSEGKPKDIHTSEGIVEAWDINGVTMFYMPLTGNMSEEDILLWRTVLTEVLV